MGTGPGDRGKDTKPRKKRGPDKQPKKKRTLKTKTPEERQASRDKKAAKARQNEDDSEKEDPQKRKRGYETPSSMQARLDSENTQKRRKLEADLRKLKKQKFQGHFVQNEDVLSLQQAIEVHL